MRRALSRTLTAVAVAAVGAVTAVAPATAATTTVAAAPGCYSSAGLPGKVTIDRPYQEVRVSLRDSCYNDYVSATLYGPQGAEDFFEWDPARNGAVDHWEVYSYFTAPGTYRAREIDSYPVQAGVETVSVVKYGSKAALTVSRSRSTVSLRACAAIYDGLSDVYVPWRGNRATIEQLSADGRSWRFVRTVTTGRDGCAAYSLQNKYRETYRVTNWETPQTWGRTSATVRS